VADGDLSEWYATDIKPFEFAATESHWSIGTFDDDNDLSATTYIAVDDNYLYFAVDVIDNVYSYDPTGNFWEDDMIEFYVGLYNETKQHRGYKRNAEPDYKYMFIADRLDQDGAGVVNLMQLEDANYEFVNFGASDWAVEVKLPLDSILVAGYASDARFFPLNGMKIRMDICFHDSDSPNVRDGVISYSEIASDNSYVGAENWNFTWIGDTDKVATSVKQIEAMVAKTYDLSQNFPNPFNPKTTIEFALAEPGKVKLEIYNTLGQKVKTVVDDYRIAGNHEVSIDASDLTSGIYFYKLQSANFTTTRKMVLMK